MSSYSILGVSLGSLFGGKLVDKMGRRKTVIFGNCLIIIITMGEMWPNFIELKIMRFLFGVSTGFILASAPKIIIETVPAELLSSGFGSAINIATFFSVLLMMGI